MKCLPTMATSLAVAFVLLYHGVPKALDPGMAMEKFTAMGFPAFLGPVVGWAEVVASIMIVTGFKGKWGALSMIVVIGVALLFVQLPKGVTAGFERDLLLLVALFSLYANSCATCKK